MEHTTLRLGIVSDTHGLFDQSLTSIFAGVEAIVHAGDIGKLEIIDRLEEIAPVFAVKGNNDHFKRFPTRRIEEFAGHRLLISHIFGELHQLGKREYSLIARFKPAVVIFGHSHRPYSRFNEETLLFNPGSAGPRRFSLPRTVGLLELDDSGIGSQIIGLQ